MGMKVSINSHKNGRIYVRIYAMLMVCLIIFIFTVGIKIIAGIRAEAASKSGIDNINNDNSGEAEETPSEIVDKPKEIPWYLVLVNKDNPIPDGYVPKLAYVDGKNHRVDERIADALGSMLKDCRKNGLDPMICSSYRSNETQISLFQSMVKRYKNQGMSDEEAVNAAKIIVAYPGTSEHQLGLAVDIVSKKYQVLDEKQEQTKVYRWLKEHCVEYGFIVRYPDGKTDITGIIYEPWHFRYVGIEAAREIMSRGITLEEYLDSQD